VTYTANDIETLSFRDAVRERVAMYMGSADNQGVLQCVREIITNSIDEATMGFGNLIIIELDKDNKVTVADYARGVPFGIREDGTEAMEAIYTQAHTGGKFNEKVYQNVAGMNGIGSKGVALSSKYFKAVSYRDGQRATLILKDGIKESFEIIDDTEHQPGTVVTFIPSEEVYNLEPIKINFNELKEMCKNWSYLTKGVRFRLINRVTNEYVEYFSKNGILDFLKESITKPIHKTPLYISVEENGIECEVAMQWAADRSEHWYVFTNGLANPEGGTSLTGVKTAITNFFKKKFKGEFSEDIARSGLFYVVNCKVPNPSFANQTKTKVNNPELRGLAQRATGQMLEDFSRRYVNEFESVLDLLTKELKAERAAERARKQVLEASKEIEKNQKKKVFASDKLKDAEFLGQNSTLLICEGDSALGAMAQARDYTKYGLLGIRGKIINCLSNSEERIFNNEEIKLLLSAMNIVPGKYNASKLRYGKLGICTDADSDGYHIGLLIMAALTYLAPEFIKEGRLCWLRAPLYIANNKGKETYYFTDSELEEAKKKKQVKGDLTRNKGLGEMSPETAQASMFNSECQRLEVMEYTPNAIDLLYELMGEEVEPRKEFIMNNIDFSTIRE
jgi:DNA gyrase/topoisomerase IV subunit B